MTIKVHTDFPCEYILNVLPASSTHIAMCSVIHVKHWTAPSAEVHNPLCCVCVSVVQCSVELAAVLQVLAPRYVGLAWLATLIHRQPCKVASRLTTLMHRQPCEVASWLTTLMH